MTNVGSPRLGYYDSVTPDFNDLGEEHVLQDTVASGDLEVVVSGKPVTVRWVRNNSGSTIQRGRVVKEMATSHYVEVAGVGDRGIGIADPRVVQDIPNGSKFLIITKGPIEVYSSATVTDGNVSDVGTSGSAIDGGSTPTATSFGTWIESGTSGNFVRACVDFTNAGFGGAGAASVPDVSAIVATTAARDALTLPAGQADYITYVSSNQLFYLTTDGGATWTPLSYQTSAATTAARDALTDVETNQLVFVNADNTSYKWNGAAWVAIGSGITPATGWAAQVNDGNSVALPDRDLNIETLQDANAVLQTLINDLRTIGILAT